MVAIVTIVQGLVSRRPSVNPCMSNCMFIYYAAYSMQGWWDHLQQSGPSVAAIVGLGGPLTAEDQLQRDSSLLKQKADHNSQLATYIQKSCESNKRRVWRNSIYKKLVPPEFKWHQSDLSTTNQ